ncbi:MAG: class I SAM-dependent methyltransferase, partial [Planctomycetota bacterium]|nr:class I SAM-dependent methyltransferase [Planctomycetota bacterium]
MRPKPTHLGPTYGAQFGDLEIVRAYDARPPYPDGLADVLAGTAGVPEPRVLEIGSGTGDLTRHLTPFAGSVHAVEPAARMCEVFRARRFAGGDVRLIHGDAETAPLDPPYDLAVAGESLHWTEWSVTLPRIGAALRPGAHLAIVERSQDPLPCAAELGRLIARYSTNQDY